MPMLATMLKSATTAMTATAATRIRRRRPSSRRKMSAIPRHWPVREMARSHPDISARCSPTTSARRPHCAAARRSRRVRATCPTALGRKAVTRPQMLSRKSRGVDAGTLAVRYSLSKSTPLECLWRARGQRDEREDPADAQVVRRKVGDEVGRHVDRCLPPSCGWRRETSVDMH